MVMRDWLDGLRLGMITGVLTVIGAEALAAVIAYFFGEVGVLRIESQHDPQNPASGRVMQKCGMQKLDYEEDLEYKGVMRHCIYYGIEKANV